MRSGGTFGWVCGQMDAHLDIREAPVKLESFCFPLAQNKAGSEVFLVKE